MFIEKGKEGESSPWIYFAVIVIVFIAFVAGQFPYMAVMYALIGGGSESLAEVQAWQFDLNLQLILMLFPFVFALCILFLCVKYIHARHPISVITIRKRIDWKRIGTGAAIWFGLLTIGELFFYILNPENFVFRFNWELFLPLLVISLFFIPFQAAFEEILIRGHMMQGLGVIAANKWLPILATSIFFGLIHSFNPEIEEYGYFNIMPFYIGFGIIMAVIAVMDDGLELAIGIHAINNIYGALLVTYPGSALQTPALFLMLDVKPWQILSFTLVASLVFIAIVSRIYKWENWRKLI